LSCCLVRLLCGHTVCFDEAWYKYDIRAFGDREGHGDMTNTPFVVSLDAFMDQVYLILFVPFVGGGVRSLMCVSRPAVLSSVVYLSLSISNSEILGRTLTL
jgi:hypothetical protein